MGKHALKARMPRVLPNHNTVQGARLRTAYVNMLERVKEPGAMARNVAVMGADAWLTWEDLGKELALAPRKKKSAQEVSRMRRRRATAAGHFLASLRTLEFLSNGHGHQEARLEDLMRLPNAGDSE